MAQVAKTIPGRDFFFRIPNRAGYVDQNHATALAAYQVVVVLFGIMNFVVTARALQIDLVHKVQLFHEQDHSKNCGIIRLGSAELAGVCLYFLQSHRAFGSKETLENGFSIASDAKPLASEKFKNAFLGEGAVLGVRVRGRHRGYCKKSLRTGIF